MFFTLPLCAPSPDVPDGKFILDVSAGVVALPGAPVFDVSPFIKKFVPFTLVPFVFVPLSVLVTFGFAGLLFCELCSEADPATFGQSMLPEMFGRVEVGIGWMAVSSGNGIFLSAKTVGEYRQNAPSKNINNILEYFIFSCLSN